MSVKRSAKEDTGRTVGDLTAKLNILLCIDNNLLFTVDRDDLRRAVGIAGVVDQAARRNSQSEYTAANHIAYPKLPFFVASTTRSSSIRKR